MRCCIPPTCLGLTPLPAEPLLRAASLVPPPFIHGVEGLSKQRVPRWLLFQKRPERLFHFSCGNFLPPFFPVRRAMLALPLLERPSCPIALRFYLELVKEIPGSLESLPSFSLLESRLSVRLTLGFVRCLTEPFPTVLAAF